MCLYRFAFVASDSVAHLNNKILIPNNALANMHIKNCVFNYTQAITFVITDMVDISKKVNIM